MKSYKKKIIFGITLLFFITILFPAFEAQIVERIVLPESSITNTEFTHTVLGEYCTKSTCPYCPKASNQIYEVYNMGYEFYMVSLVSGKNTNAGTRINELGYYEVPDVAFDGGNIKIEGQQTSNIPYKEAIIECGARTVADIDIDLEVYWLGDSKLQIYVDITNNEESTYTGHLHVYVTEITSRWNDEDGNPFHFAWIGNHPIHKEVEVEPGTTETYTTAKPWTAPYDNITIDNIKVIASVFNPSTKYPDETAGANPEYPNTDAPSIPSKPTGPSSGNTSGSYTFSTSSTESNRDLISYGWDWEGDGDVNDWTDFYPSGQTIEATNSWGSTGTYTIKVKAKDQFGTESGWSEPAVIEMPKNKMYYPMSIIFERFIHRISLIEKILNHCLS